jgi:hypothetical protein
MIVPFFALLAVIAIVIGYIVMNAKNKDKGNRRV